MSGVSCVILSEPRRGALSVALTAGVRPRVHPRLHYSVLGALEYPVLLERTDYTRGLISTCNVEMSIATPFIYIIFIPHLTSHGTYNDPIFHIKVHYISKYDLLLFYFILFPRVVARTPIVPMIVVVNPTVGVAQWPNKTLTKCNPRRARYSIL